MSSEKELIANQMDVEQLGRWLDVDSLVYLSVDDMREVAKSIATPCTACFSNQYVAGHPSDFVKAASPK